MWNIKVIKHTKKADDKVSDLVFQSRVWMAYTENKTWGHILKQGKQEISTNPDIEHLPVCALNEREVLWKKLVRDHVI